MLRHSRGVHTFDGPYSHTSACRRIKRWSSTLHVQQPLYLMRGQCTPNLARALPSTFSAPYLLDTTSDSVASASTSSSRSPTSSMPASRSRACPPVRKHCFIPHPCVPTYSIPPVVKSHSDNVASASSTHSSASSLPTGYSRSRFTATTTSYLSLTTSSISPRQTRRSPRCHLTGNAHARSDSGGR